MDDLLNINLKVSTDTFTSYPWWIIIDPKQNFNVNHDGLHNIASMITGPFFSREEAQKHLNNRKYAFSKNACVYCHSGYWSKQYKDAINESSKEKINE